MVIQGIFFFLFLHKNICYGQGASNEYQQYVFIEKLSQNYHQILNFNSSSAI